MFLYERDEHMTIRRLEDKLGIHGSPTCELQFDDAPALLVGERRRGLTTYVMSLMNGARIAIAAQAQGIAEAAYRAAAKYADERVQFGGPIRELTAGGRHAGRHEGRASRPRGPCSTRPR